MPFRQIPDLEIPADVSIPTCDTCGEEILGKDDLAALDAAMSAAYTRALSRKSEVAIRELGGAIHQRELERLIGVSAGYVSKLKNAQSEPSGPMTALLMLLASDAKLVDRLRTLWSMQVSVGAAPWEPSSVKLFLSHSAAAPRLVERLPEPAIRLDSSGLKLRRAKAPAGWPPGGAGEILAA
jgi:transcriptional regulator with XRE-family HTH domain